MELWRFFEPYDGGGTEPDYTFLGNRSTLGVRYDGRRWSMNGELQYVRVEGLPRGAIGPGLLGNGGAYFFQAADTFSYQFYLRALSAAYTSAVTPRLGGDRPAVAGARSGAAVGSHRESRPRAAVGAAAGRHGGFAVRACVGRRPRAPGSRPLAVDSHCRDAHAGHLRGIGQSAHRSRAGRDRSTSPQPPARSSIARGCSCSRRGIATPATCAPVPTTPGSQPLPPMSPSSRWAHRRPACIPAIAAAWDFTAWSAGQFGDWYGQPHRALSALAEGGFRWTSRTRAAAGAGRDGLRVRRWRRDGRPARDVLPDAALGRPLRAVEYLRPDERARCLGRGPARAAPRPPPAGRRAPGDAGLDRRPLVLGQRRHRAARQLLRLPGPQHPRRRARWARSWKARRRGGRFAGGRCAATWPTWPAATLWAPSSPTAGCPRPWSRASASRAFSIVRRAELQLCLGVSRTARHRPESPPRPRSYPRRSRCSHRRGPCS